MPDREDNMADIDTGSEDTTGMGGMDDSDMGMPPESGGEPPPESIADHEGLEAKVAHLIKEYCMDSSLSPEEKRKKVLAALSLLDREEAPGEVPDETGMGPEDEGPMHEGVAKSGLIGAGLGGLAGTMVAPGVGTAIGAGLGGAAGAATGAATSDTAKQLGGAGLGGAAGYGLGSLAGRGIGTAFGGAAGGEIGSNIGKGLGGLGGAALGAHMASGDKDEKKEAVDMALRQLRDSGDPANVQLAESLDTILAVERKKEKDLMEELDKYKAAEAYRKKYHAAKELCRKCNLQEALVTDVFLEQLTGHDEKGMKALIEDRKAIAGIRRPVSSPGFVGRKTDATKVEMTPEQFALKLRRG